MIKVRRRSPTFEAYKWNGEKDLAKKLGIHLSKNKTEGTIYTDEGLCFINPGDWVILNKNVKTYCQQQYFDSMYEEIKCIT